MLVCILTAICISVWAESGIYVGGYFRRARTVTVPTLKNSGFTYAILFNINVEANGDLTMDGDTLCANGKYVFDSTNPNYIADVTALRTSFSTIRRVECCIGGWTNQSYFQIRDLIKAQGTGTSSILYKNFQALRNAIPAIEAINNDDEGCYDVETATAFHVMLYDIGFKTTIAPYTRKSFWQSFVTNVNNLRPDAVDRVDLQCYDGGAGNNPNDWNLGVKMTAGMLSYTANGATAIPAQMTAWKNTTSIVGGFYWVYNDNSFNLKTFAAYINNVFGDGAMVDAGKMAAHVTIYPEKNYGGEGVDFQVGKYDATAIKWQNMPAKSSYSVKVNTGFSIDFYNEDAWQGESVHVNQNNEDLSSLGVENAISWKVNPDIDESIQNQYVFIKNRKSGLFMSLKDNVSTPGTPLQQKIFSGDKYQRWSFRITKYGSYRIVNSATNYSVQIKDASVNDFANLEQGGYAEAFNQEFVALSCNGFYKLIPLNSMKYVSVEKENEYQENAYIVQSGDGDDLSAYWQVITQSEMSLVPPVEQEIKIYPTLVNDLLYIDCNSNNINQIQVFDLQGKEIMNLFGNKNVIDVSGLHEGLYITKIVLKESDKPIFRKFVKK